MIDTIRFEIDLSGKNEPIFNVLLRGEKVTVGGMRFVETGSILTEIKTKEFLQLKITSGSQDIHYSINTIKMTCTFEFSVPKYLFGHNLFQAFPYGECISKNLRDFIYTFFQNEFGIEIEFHTMRLLRIDPCLNLYFDTPEQKEEFMIIGENIFSDLFSEGKLMRYDGTTFYKLKEYSFKIYDKGKEFIKNDYKKIRRYKSIEKATRLAELSQRIARCELTLRHQKISYLFFDELERTTQCLHDFKMTFNNLRGHYNKVNRALTNITNCFNKYMYVELNESISEAIKEKIKQNVIPEFIFTDPEPLFQSYVLMKKKRQNPFNPSELSYVVDKISKAKMATYNNYRSPKPIVFKTTPDQKKFNTAVRPTVLEFDKALAHQCFRMFDEVVFKLIKNCSVSDKPLDVLKPLQKKDKGNKQLKSVYRYFLMAEKHSDKSLINRQMISKKTIDRIKKDYLPKINANLEAANLPQIGKFKIKAFPATAIDHNTHQPL